MSTKSIHERSRAFTERARETDIKVLKTTLDEITDTENGFSDEQRKELAESAKELLDSHVAFEKANSNLEFTMGKSAGFNMGVAAVVIGFTLGKGTIYLLKKLSEK